ncbi:hypothetical protein GOP47_0016726 [Adiantum capillus-veneris]|uniref:Uncharacterized protein n=1 Tax=Adiantum capillus-veneris TaxID=13818 RepID=A0A9D4ZD91_ADICA|nr:hypothetical protein GOP47_0016726 [Adiantum capillus-veneris]
MKKRRIEGRALEDVERTLHTSFCAAANSISQLYTQAQNQNKIAFHAGQRHALEKLFDSIHHQHGGRPSAADISNYIKAELDNVSQAELSVMQTQNAPPFAQQHMAPTNPFTRVTTQERSHTPYQNGFFSG